MRRRKVRENSSKKRVSLHDTRARGKVQKCTEMHTQKRSLMTRYRRKGKSLDFPGKTEFVDTIRAQEKSYKKLHKKECASRHIGHPKKQITKKY